MKHFQKIKFSIHQLRQKFKQGKVTRWQKFKYLFLGLVSFCFVLGLGLFTWVWATLPDIDDPKNMFTAQSSVITDRNGEVLYKVRGDEDREIVPFEKISEWAGLAVISIEDDQFYEHGGYDIPAIMKAVCSEVGICSQARGGSTITQQYISNTFLNKERSYLRKAREILLAMQLEDRYSKNEILSLYLNRIPYGGQIYGIEVASKSFFGKSSADLTIAESAILASLPKSPTQYSPYGENLYAKIVADEEIILEKDLRTEQEVLEASEDYIVKGLLGKTYTFGEGDQKRDIYVKGRVAFVLERMLELGHITEEEKDKAQAEADNMVFQPPKNSLEKAPHFVIYVQQLLEEKYGSEKIQKGGLKITTTLNLEMQKMAEESIAAYGEKNANTYKASNASLIALDPNNGQILAMVGSRDYNDEENKGKNNLTTSPTQPGSSFKPFVYAAAFAKGYAPSTVTYDVKTKFDTGGGAPYEPNNYSGKFTGPVTFRNALGSSLNIPAIKAGYVAGMENVMNLVREMGIEIPEQEYYGLASALGTTEISPLDMARGYSVFANGGYKVDPVYILKIEDAEGNILEEFSLPEERKVALDPQATYLINDVLTDENARPAGNTWRGALTLPGGNNGAKTGTSNIPGANHGSILPRDNWTIGYVRNLVAAVWVGNPDREPLAPSADGLTTAAPIWKDFMLKATEKVEKGEYPTPEGLKWVNISKRSGNLASKKTPSGDIVKAPFASYGVPHEYDNSYQLVKIDKVSGKLATEFTPEDAIEEKAFLIHHDILPEWDAAAQAWARAAGQGGPPTEYDDVHTAENMNAKPEITITSPRTNSTISPPRVSVVVDIVSPAGVNRVDYFLDNELLSTVSTSPFNTSLSIPASFENGSTHTIKAIVYDDLLRSAQSSVNFRIGEDDTPPTVSIGYPKNNAKLTAGSSVGIQFEAYDGNGDVISAKYYVDGKLYQNDIEYPFQWQLKVPEKEGTYTLKVEAFDQGKNSSADSIDIQVVEEEALEGMGGMGGGTSYISSPASNSSFAEGENVSVSGKLSSGDQASIQKVVFYAKKSGQSAQQIGSVPGSSGNGSYSIVWSSPPAGTYEIYMEVITEDSSSFTSRVPIVVGI